MTVAEINRIDEMTVPMLREELRNMDNVKQCSFEAGYGREWLEQQAAVINRINTLTGKAVRILMGGM